MASTHAVDGVDTRHDAFALDTLTPSSRHNCGDSSRRWKGTVELDFYTAMDHLHDLSGHPFTSSK